ncbi:Toxin YhaV [Legionella pneumophila]|uniref:Toxin YhaV n=1 Tax=Legionella pneumophila subsp. pneumophila TaxID=91891 RepID=A0AAV2UVY8_LEGPN|nr:type II toxin-antitoxin system YhaV family toxin [Legionella pneumophila]CCD05138.1 conserved hypothetical protein [Legionella pneumophila subsp. pneumophila]CZH32094.1 Toxin YhaV [Legionella pneumophila]CZI18831.1 Toxin YhaV [Legionella pneumophila]CZL86611.1 Toxin YhaV [Legionella pneumophila]CZL93252.1 Toxin YhaV [Legionella pneumophila]
MGDNSIITINGWAILCHPLFLQQVEALANEVENAKQKDPSNFHTRSSTKKLAAIAKLAFEKIPNDPAATEFRQGSTLGNNHKHWFRAKFFQQYRLFFRFHQESKIIIYAWVNDDSSKRAYESKADAYHIFRKMLESGHPPDNWDELLKEANNPTLMKKLTTSLDALRS